MAAQGDAPLLRVHAGPLGQVQLFRQPTRGVHGTRHGFSNRFLLNGSNGIPVGSARKITCKRQEEAPRSAGTEEDTALPSCLRALFQPGRTTFPSMPQKPRWPTGSSETKDHNSQDAAGHNAYPLLQRMRVSSPPAVPIVRQQVGAENNASLQGLFAYCTAPCSATRWHQAPRRQPPPSRGGSRPAGRASHVVCSLRETAGAARNTTRKQQEKAAHSTGAEEITAHPKWPRATPGLEAERRSETTVPAMLRKETWPIGRPEHKDHNSHHAAGQDTPRRLLEPTAKSMLSHVTPPSLPLRNTASFPYTIFPKILLSPCQGPPGPPSSVSSLSPDHSPQSLPPSRPAPAHLAPRAKTAEAYPHHHHPCPFTPNPCPRTCTPPRRVAPLPRSVVCGNLHPYSQ